MTLRFCTAKEVLSNVSQAPRVMLDDVGQSQH